ncbi:MAG TPA: aldo/keto reductase [Anaerolineae bacterium]|nr:aldo/keto reductase [Anaerolineales bacterium]HSD82241.1 aldo/keto reductase [Anaerolineae bacterium]
MKNETVHGVSVPKIGFGTWRIGGESYADPKADPAAMAALRAALEAGYTHFDTAEGYASGHSEELVGRLVREANAKRERLFITTKVSPEHLQYDQVLRSCENSLRRLQMEYIDLYLIHWPPRLEMELNDAFRALNQLVRDGKVKHLGVSNFKLKLLKQAQSLSETPLLTDQVPYRLPDRVYVENGVLEYCQQNEILLTAYSPVKFRNLSVNKTVRLIAEAHSATPFQIALAWLVAQPRVITIPMSLNPRHIRENFKAAEIELSKEEIEMLNGLY